MAYFQVLNISLYLVTDIHLHIYFKIIQCTSDYSKLGHHYFEYKCYLYYTSMISARQVIITMKAQFTTFIILLTTEMIFNAAI